MPQERVAAELARVPVPLHCLPQVRNALGESVLDGGLRVGVLTRSQQPLHEECGLNEVSAVVEPAEDRHGLAGSTVHEMRPRAVETICLLKEGDDAGEPLHALRAGDEAAIHADEDSHDAEAAGSSGHHARVAGHTLKSHSGLRVRALLPVVAEALLLHHGEQLVVG